MEIFGWRLVWPIKVVYSRERGFGWSRGWPLWRVRPVYYAHLASDKQPDD